MNLPRGSMYTTIMELSPQNQNRDGLSGPNSIMVVYMEPLGFEVYSRIIHKPQKGYLKRTHSGPKKTK